MSKFVTSAVLTLAVAGAVVPATTIVASANSHKELKTVKVGKLSRRMVKSTALRSSW